jgi:phosphoribosyl 1,2-cyclic phosphodiesterase
VSAAPIEICFWGVRGSVPAPGPEMNRYGGNTSCVELRIGGELVIIDAGTGLIPLGRELLKSEFGKGKGMARLFLSHAHWDHIQGFPFFGPIFIPGNKFAVYGPGRSSAVLENILEGQMNPHFSPLYTMKNLGAAIEVNGAEGKDGVRIGTDQSVKVTCCTNPHGPTSALAYRFEHAGRAVVYASDAGYAPSGPSPEACQLYAGAHTLIHDCTYSPEDRQARLQRGFASTEDAARAAIQAKVQRLVMFHYDQDYNDDVVDALAERTRRFLDDNGGASITLEPAREGLRLTV